MSPRIVLLAGVPPASAIEEESCTVKQFEAPFHALFALENTHLSDDDDDDGGGGVHQPATQPAIAPWRWLSLRPRPPSLRDDADAFFSTSRLSSGRGDESAALDEFCEQSLALHQSGPGDDDDNDDDEEEEEEATATTNSDETSLALDSTTATATNGEPPSLSPTPPDIWSARLSRLRDVPSATHLVSLQPQTVTVDLVVGILSVARPRAVTTRWGQTLSLLEMLVGDDTRSGFAVTFWLPADVPVPAPVPASADPTDLRRQDVVLIRSVALHVFRGKVYGQSLRRGRTRLHLLWTRRPDARACYTSKTLAAAAAAAGESHPQLLRASTVRDWVLAFVGRDPGDRRHVWDRPPDDTQD